MLANENPFQRQAVAVENRRLIETIALERPSLTIAINRGSQSKRPSLKIDFKGGHLKMPIFINSYI